MTRTRDAIVWRLQSLAQARGVPTDKLLSRWVGDGFLARLACSSFADRVVLKGATLFTLWDGDMVRSTRDINLHFQAQDRAHAYDMLRQITGITAQPFDGVRFEVASIRFERIIGPSQPGIRMSLDAIIGQTITPLKVNVIFGNPITPGAELRWYPRLLHGFKSFPIWTYPKETVIAEKLATAVEFGRCNTCLRDYYDVWYISRRYHFVSHVLCEAIENTFTVRAAERFLRSDCDYWKAAFSTDFATSANRRSWDKWLSDQIPTTSPPDFGELIAEVGEFSLPPLVAAAQRRRLKARWIPGKKWVKTGLSRSPVGQNYAEPTAMC
jgi:predicted nucleotidyltransferase component of viral defense system